MNLFKRNHKHWKEDETAEIKKNLRYARFLKIEAKGDKCNHNASCIVSVVAKVPDNDDDVAKMQWPTKCNHCDYVFKESDTKEVLYIQLRKVTWPKDEGTFVRS